ncbi:MAG: vWA domain-containing protein [Aquabacterium sp.]
MLQARNSPGRLADNVMHFGRVLRSAGLPVGTDRIALAQRALRVAGLASREEFHAVLASCLISRAEHRELFDAAFDLFWRDPDLEGRMRALLLPKAAVAAPPPPALQDHQRLAEAMYPQPPGAPPQEPPPSIEVDAELTFSGRERLYQADFDSMSNDEWRAALKLLPLLRAALPRLPTRRQTRALRPGRLDARATLAAMGRSGGELLGLRWREPVRKPPPLLVLADISGSMSRYSRMLLHFAHRLSQAQPQVESFVFGTRLTRITRALTQRDPDLAVAQAVRSAQDWSGGTRIAVNLEAFNRQWARRVLNSRATVLLITDGLEHGDTAALGFEMERLHKSCARLLWLNPLLRFARFEPRAGGIKAMLPHVDRHLPVHNLASLEQLVRLLAGHDAPPRLHRPAAAASAATPTAPPQPTPCN